MVICSTWLLGSGTLPTRMSRAVSMRRLVSVSSIGSPSGGELVQGDVVLDVFGNERAILLGHGFAELVEGVVLLGLIENLAVDVVDDTVPLSGLDRPRDGFVLAHRVLELLEEHPIYLHPLVPDGLFLDHRENVGAEVFVDSA